MKTQGNQFLSRVGLAITLVIAGNAVAASQRGPAGPLEMMRWLWRDQPVSVDPRNTVERSFRSRK